MKLAVLMAAYNAAPYVGDALASLLQQRTAAKLQIIVVNDGSTDGTGDIVRAISAQAPEVNLVETANRGISAARNRALDEVSPDTELISMLDADDLSPAGRFARDIKHFTDDSQLGFHYGTTRMFRDISDDRLTPDTSTGKYVDLRGVQLGASLMRKSLADAVGRFDESFVQAEDTDFFFRMFQLRPRIRVVDDVCCYYRRHDRNITLQQDVSDRFYRRVIFNHIKRQKSGGAPVPDGFFDFRPFNSVDWL
ncbi:MAG TPA: glycosyltransferase family A protein [Devosia sp.]|nr:glycosyltransferase family A protein [Devosia sp.]